MRKRSEAKPTSKPSAAERTAPIVFTDPETNVTCPLCDHVAKVKKCPQRENGTLECPECGSPIEGKSEIPSTPKEKKPDLPSKAIEDVAPRERASAPSMGTPHPDVAEIEKKTQAKIDAFEASTSAHESPPKIYCAKCGSEWPIVDGKQWINCGHDGQSVDDPRKVERYSPPAGTPRVGIIGKHLVVSRGRSTFPTVPYGSFHVGPFSISAETMPDVNVIDLAKRMRAELRQIADDAFEEELAWYEEKLAKVQNAGNDDQG